MSTAPTANPVTRAYCNTDDIAPYIAPNVIGDGAANPIKVERVIREMEMASRKLDGLLGSRCFTPFPARGSPSPKTPAQVVEWTTYEVAAKLNIWASQGNRKGGLPTRYLALRDSILSVDETTGQLKGSILADQMMEFVSRETMGVTTLDGGTNEHGWMGETTLYQLANRGLIVDAAHPIAFLNASGVRIVDTAGLPHRITVEDAALGVINVWNRSAIESDATYISYWFSWWDCSRFNVGGGSHPTAMPAYGG